MDRGNLEEYLKKNDKVRFEIYQDVQKAAKKIWKNSRLPWYTDHGESHSERVIAHLNQICAGLLKDPQSNQPEYGLTPVEVFLLLSAAWLHDVGMQDLSGLGKHSVDQMDENDWENVRKRHPQRSFEIIMAHAGASDETNEFRTGLHPDHNLHAPLALICKGHGSDYYQEVVDTFEKRTFDLDGQGVPIRGGLITALLLMADEIDLHNSRAALPGNFPLSRISRLHFYRHYYVQHVEVAAGKGNDTEVDRKIYIKFAFPEGSEKWQGNLKEWIETKLKIESHRTSKQIRSGFQGHFSWSDPLVESETEQAMPKEKREMEIDVRFLLETQIRKTIDWKNIINDLKTRFKERNGGIVCLNSNGDQEIELFLTLLESIFRGTVEYHDFQPLISKLKFKPIEKYHTKDDVFQAIGDELGVDLSEFDDTDTGVTQWDFLYSNIKNTEKFCLIVFQGLGEIEQELRSSILNDVLGGSKLKQGDKSLILIFDLNSLHTLSDCSVIDFPSRFKQDDVYAYFIDTGNSEKDAGKKTEKIMAYQKTGRSVSEVIRNAKFLN